MTITLINPFSVAPVTRVIRSDTVDRDLYSSGNPYSTVRAGLAIAFNNGVNDDALDAGQISSGSDFACYETFLSFDTSSVAGTILSATLSVTPLGVFTTAGAFTLEARLHDWGAGVDTGDWVAGASLGSKTLLASIASSGLTVAVTSALTSDAAFISNINAGGTTRLLLCSSEQRLGNAPSLNTQGEVQIHSGDAATAGQRPTLTVVSTG